MAHNTSRNKLGAMVRCNPLEDYRGSHFVCRCAPCARFRRVPVNTLLDVLPAGNEGVTVGGVIIRFRCATCRASPSQVDLTDDIKPGVTLLGPGSN